MSAPTYRFPLLLLGVYLVVFAVCATSPYDRSVWFAENLPIVIIVCTIFWVSRYHRFSNTAYVLMAVLPIMHTVGGHYTFEPVPFGWITETFGFERNHYDRIAHFSVGFYAYPIAEVFSVKRLVTSKLLILILPVLDHPCRSGRLRGFRVAVCDWVQSSPCSSSPLETAKRPRNLRTPL